MHECTVVLAHGIRSFVCALSFLPSFLPLPAITLPRPPVRPLAVSSGIIPCLDKAHDPALEMPSPRSTPFLTHA